MVSNRVFFAARGSDVQQDDPSFGHMRQGVPGELAAYIQLAVADAVESQVCKLRLEFAKREQMLMQVVMSHAEQEKDLAERIAALEQQIASCSPVNASARQ